MIIGISGKISVGKDTVAGIIRELTAPVIVEYGKITENGWESMTGVSSWQVKKFAGPLKQRIAITWGIDVKQLEDQDFKKQLSPLGITWRELMQKEGEKMREIDENYWVKATMSHYKPIGSEDSEGRKFHTLDKPIMTYPKWLITDLRYPNEAKAIKDKNGTLLRIVRENKITHSDGMVWIHPHGWVQYPPHHSETALDDFNGWDYVIENNGTIEELKEQVKQFLIKFNLI